MPLSMPTAIARNIGAIHPRVATARPITSSTRATSTVIGCASWVPALVTVFQNDVRADSSCRSMESSVRPTHPWTREWISHWPSSNMKPSIAAAASETRRKIPFMSALSRAGTTNSWLRTLRLEAGFQWPVWLAQVVLPGPEAGGHRGEPGGAQDPAADDVADVVDAQADPGIADEQHDRDA